jgi:hypothetical protein
VQSAYLQSTGSISQTVNLAAGTYNLGFELANRAPLDFAATVFSSFDDGDRHAAP